MISSQPPNCRASCEALLGAKIAESPLESTRKYKTNRTQFRERSITNRSMPRKKADRFQLKPPPGLGELLRKVNELPADEPELSELLTTATNDAGTFDFERFNELLHRQEMFRARKLLRVIAMDLLTRPASPPGVSGCSGSYEFNANLTITLDGKLIPGPGTVLDSILYQQVNQVRLCQRPECSILFWAGRPKQTCCSPRCAKVMRTRKSRKLWDEKGGEYNAHSVRKEK